MITYLKIDGFKSFSNFEMEFSPLTVIAGANASGKSNLFDALRLLSRLAETDLTDAFREQRGNPNELFTQYNDVGFAHEMSFIVEMIVNKTIKDKWGGVAELKYTRLKYSLKIRRSVDEIGLERLNVVHEHLENYRHEEDLWVKKYIPKNFIENWRPKVSKGRRGTPYIETEEGRAIIIRQDDSGGNKKELAIEAGITQTVLSGLNSVDFKHAFAVKEEMRSWKFLQLNPEDLREPTRQDVGMKDEVTQSGKNLAAALFRIQSQESYVLREISRKINSILPNFVTVDVVDDKAAKQFVIKLKGEDGREFSSRVLSEGTLRMLALCIFQYDPRHTGLLCFEEPENGIHPFRIKAIALLLKDLSTDFRDVEMPLRQVVVNTHSPVLVSNLVQWKDDTNVSIWLSQSTTLVGDFEGVRMKLKITKMFPVNKSDDVQLPLWVTNLEEKLTIAEVKRYLDTADPEQAKNALPN